MSLLLAEDRGAVRVLTMNRPDKQNSLVHPLRGAILDTLAANDQDRDVSVTIEPVSVSGI